MYPTLQLMSLKASATHTAKGNKLLGIKKWITITTCYESSDIFLLMYIGWLLLACTWNTDDAHIITAAFNSGVPVAIMATVFN